MNLVASVIVSATIQVEGVGGRWGTGTTMDQIYKQAIDSFPDIFKNGHNDFVSGKIKFIGEPKVKAVITEEI